MPVQQKEEYQKSTKIYSLEEFIFNCATLMLNPRELFFFKIIVLANRSNDIEYQWNNIYNQFKLINYLKDGPVDPTEVDRKDREIVDNTPNQDIDEAISFLFDKGFIARYTKYESDAVNSKTQLTFRANVFVSHMKEQLKQLMDDIKQDISTKMDKQNARYRCTSQNCNGEKIAPRYENLINAQISKYKNIRQVVCPVCKTKGFVEYSSNSTDDSLRELNTALKYVKELYDEAVELHHLAAENNDYLERELRSMRANFNQRPTKAVTAEEEEEQVDVTGMFLNKQVIKQQQLMEMRNKRLQLSAKGINSESLYHRIGPVYKAPRVRQASSGGMQQPPWLEEVHRKAERALAKE